MIDKYITRPQWEAKLRRHGCEPLEGKGELNTAEWWKSPKGAPFTVPIEDNGNCEFWALHRICQKHGLPIPVIKEEDRVVKMRPPPDID
jgi:hypothetical protein